MDQYQCRPYARPTKCCSRCRRKFDLIFFTPLRSNRRNRPIPTVDIYRRSYCKHCEQTGRDHQKAVNPFLAKAHSAIRDHAHRWKVPVKLLHEQYGWRASDIARQMAHAYTNGCPICGRLYATMGHGFADLTLDIIDPQKYREQGRPPHWPDETRLVCNTCNQEKGDLSPENAAILRQEWQRAETEPWPEDPQLDMFNLPAEMRQRQQWHEFTRTPSLLIPVAFEQLQLI